MSAVGSGWLERLFRANPQSLPKIKTKIKPRKYLPGQKKIRQKVVREEVVGGSCPVLAAGLLSAAGGGTCGWSTGEDKR